MSRTATSELIELLLPNRKQNAMENNFLFVNRSVTKAQLNNETTAEKRIYLHHYGNEEFLKEYLQQPTRSA